MPESSYNITHTYTHTHTHTYTHTHHGLTKLNGVK